MSDPLQLAVIGLGRMGTIHARHARQLEQEGEECQLVALVDSDLGRAQRLAAYLSTPPGPPIRTFEKVEELLESCVSTASIVATPTDKHREHTTALVATGQRVLLEKPMTESLTSDRELAVHLDRVAPEAVMLAFQRRFDAPLQFAKRLLDDGAIGRPFKFVSILEDSNPLPDGYASPGLLADMSVHNVDEVLWLSGHCPVAAACIGSRLYSYRLTTADEDFDDGLLYVWFEDEMAAQIQVSRNHVPGYRVETWIFGEKGNIHAGHFERKPFEVVVEAYGREKTIAREVFRLKPHGPDVPEFVDRFGQAYKEELAYFVRQCRAGERFSVNHKNGLQAMEVIDAAARSPITREMGGGVAGGA